MTTALAPWLGRCAFPPPGSSVTCAVSGGADSSALLALAVAAGLRVSAVHVDHGLREGSAAEAPVVGALADRLGAAFEARTVEVRPGPNLEARARAARYAALPEGVLTGHTADDLAETILLNLLRGAGLDGLAPMRPRPGGPRRPIVALRRSDTVAICAAIGHDPVADPTNADPAFRRNRVRHEVVPLLAEVARRDVVDVLVAQVPLLADEADLLDSLAADLDPTDGRALAAAPVALARRAVRRWLAQGYPPTARAVEDVLAVARGDRLACEVPGGGRVRRTAGRLELAWPPGPLR